MNILDLPSLTSISRPTLHPDGTWAVFGASHPNLAANAYVGQLWRVETEGSSTPTRITRGFRDSAPQFSPDGTRIAFLRSGPESPAQIFVMLASGGEPVAATEEKLGVSAFDWSPDGASIAFIARVAEPGRYGTVENIKPSSEPPRRIVTRKYQFNSLGYTIDRRAHVFMVATPNPSDEPSYQSAPSAEDPQPAPSRSVQEPRQLTTGDFDHSLPKFSPSGDRIGFLSARHPDRDIDIANGIYEVQIGTPDAEPVSALSADSKYRIDGFAYARDASLFFIGVNLGESGRDFVGRSSMVHRVDRKTGLATALTDPETSDFAEGAEQMKFSADGILLALTRWRGNRELVSIAVPPLKSAGLSELSSAPQVAEVSTVLGGEVVVDGFDTAQHRTIVSIQNAFTPGEIGVFQGGSLDIRTDFASALKLFGIAPIVELNVASRDGQQVQGWVLTPKSDGPHPVLLNIHGGPHAQYTCALFDEAQVYVDAGYAVVMCNPRGAAGYGETFGRSIKNRMGTVDFTDVLDFLDGALTENASFDQTRLGIMGGSYGGYLTAWTISQDHRFTAAIVERGFLDPETFVGTSDIGDFFGDEYVGTEPAQIRAQSPQAFVHQVQTPTLVLHSENDLRCPLSQTERYYAALKRHGVETEMLIFPGENHELSRSGLPRHRVQRFEAILDWWQRYLPV